MNVSFPSWLKATAVLFVCVFIPAHWHYSGPINFLWLSDIGLFGTVLALLLENRLLASMMLLATLLPDGVGWDVDFLVALMTGWHPLNATVYMFDPQVPALIRGLSIFHPLVPALLVWMVHRLGYDRRALVAQSLLTSVVLLLTYLLTHPDRNINWVYGPGQPQSLVPEWLYLLAMIAGLPVLFYLPVHWLLRSLKWDDRRAFRHSAIQRG
ncbi:MAG: hypothetical protein L0Z52_05870 [Acidobacteria bacterium]|nr:hypothetical protein [Acidobacteriota bacterium]